MDSNHEVGLRYCKCCRKIYDVSDLEFYSDFCSYECELIFEDKND